MKKTININNNLDERIQQYIKLYGMTYTTFISLACEHYLNSINKSKDINKLVNDMFKQMIENNVKNTTIKD